MRMLLRYCAGLSVLMSGLPAFGADLGGLPVPQTPQRIPYVAAPSPPAPRYYIALRGGVVADDDITVTCCKEPVGHSFSGGYEVSGAVGIYLDRVLGEVEGLRGDLEFGHKSAQLKKQQLNGVITEANGGSQSADFFFASLYYDAPQLWGFTPFIGAGVGLANVSYKSNKPCGCGPLIDSSATDWVYHATAGVSTRVNKEWQLEAAYRYMDVPTSKPENTDGERQHIEARSHQLLFGVIRNF